MATTYTSNLKLQQPAFSDRNWHVPILADIATLDGLNAIADLAVTTAEVPSASLNVSVAPGVFQNAAGSLVSYAGTSTLAISSSSTVYVWLTDLGAITTGASFPATCIPLAVVVTGATTVTSIADWRVAYSVIGAANLSLPLAGGTMNDGANIAVGSTTGTQLATATTQKLGLWGASPIVQPSGASQAALTDSTTGTASTTVANVGTTFNQSTLNNNFASVLNLLNEIRAALVAAGVIKGSA